MTASVSHALPTMNLYRNDEKNNPQTNTSMIDLRANELEDQIIAAQLMQDYDESCPSCTIL